MSFTFNRERGKLARELFGAHIVGASAYVSVFVYSI